MWGIQPTEICVNVICDGTLCLSYSRSYGLQDSEPWLLKGHSHTPAGYRSLHISTNFHLCCLPTLQIDPFWPPGWFPDTLKVLHLFDFPIESEFIHKIRTLTDFALLGPKNRIYNPKILFNFLEQNTLLENVKLNGTFWRDFKSPFSIKRKLKNLKTLTVRVIDSNYDIDPIPWHFSDLPKDAHLIVELDASESPRLFECALSYIVDSPFAKKTTHLRMDCPAGKLEFSRPNSPENKVSILISDSLSPLGPPDIIETTFRTAVLEGEVRPFFKRVEDIRLVYHSKPHLDPSRPETVQGLLRLFPALKTLETEEVPIKEDHPLTRQPFQSPLDQLEGAST